MRKKHVVIEFMLVLSLFMLPSAILVSGIGLSPAEMRVVDAEGSGVIGNIVLVNTESEPKNIVLQIQSPPLASSEQKHLRVICEDCHDTHQRYEIIEGCCPRCGSHNLTFYERIPDEVLNYISLRGKDCNLIKKGSVYFTSEKYLPKEQCSVEILLDLLNKEEYSDKHWEAYVTVTTTSDITAPGMGVAAGVQMRLLLDVPTIKSSFFSFGEIPPIIFGYVAGGFIVVLCLVYIYRKISVIKSTKDFKSRNKPKPIKAEIEHVREPLFSSLEGVATADINQTGQEEPSSSFLGNVRNTITAETIQPNQEETPATYRGAVEDASTTDSIQPKHKKPCSDIEEEIDCFLKSHEK